MAYRSPARRFELQHRRPDATCVHRADAQIEAQLEELVGGGFRLQAMGAGELARRGAKRGDVSGAYRAALLDRSRERIGDAGRQIAAIDEVADVPQKIGVPE